MTIDINYHYLPTFTIHPTCSSLIINFIAHLDSKLLLRLSYEYVVRTFRLLLEHKQNITVFTLGFL